MASGSKPPNPALGGERDVARLLSAIERAAPAAELNVKTEDPQFRASSLQDDPGARPVSGATEAVPGQFGLQVRGKRWQPAEPSIFNFNSIPQLLRPPLPLQVTPHPWLWPHFGEWQVRGLRIPRPARPAATVKYVVNDQQMASSHGQAMGVDSFNNIATAGGLVQPKSVAASTCGLTTMPTLPSSSGLFPRGLVTPNGMVPSSGFVPGLGGLSSNIGVGTNQFLASKHLGSASGMYSRGGTPGGSSVRNTREVVAASSGGGVGPSGHNEQKHVSSIPRVWRPVHVDGVRRAPPRRGGCLLFEKRLSTSDVSCKRNDVTLPLAELEAIYHDVSRRNEPIAVDVQVTRDGEQSPVFTCEIKWWQKESGGYYSLTKSKELKKYFGANIGQFLACYSTNSGGWKFVVQDAPTQTLYQPRMKRPRMEATDWNAPKAKRGCSHKVDENSVLDAGNGI